MCGLTGVLSSMVTANDKGIFEDLMLVSTLRGRYGAGIVAVPEKPKKGIRIHRTLSTGCDLVDDADYRKSNDQRLTCLAGHTRQPTSGGYKLTDVHPHEFGNLIGMHNGTMNIINGVPVNNKKDNDSSMLFRCISDYGLKKTITNSKGALALVYIDKALQTLNFYRNKERSLFLAYPETGTDTIFWASEMRFLNMVLGRSLGEKFKIIALPEETHWEFDVRPFEKDNIKLKSSNKLFDTVAQLPAIITGPSIPIHEPKPRAPELQGSFHLTFRGQQILTSQLERIMKDGCSNCKTMADWDDYTKDEMHFYNKTEFMCDVCYRYDDNAKTMVDQANNRGAF